MAADQAKTALRVSGVTKSFDSGLHALEPISLEIAENGFVAVVGPSGCGKSTLLRIIAGLSTATDGDVRYGSGISPTGTDVSFVFQDPTLMPWASVAENVALPLKLKGENTSAVVERVSEVLNWVDLTQFKNAYPRELSGGMRMRTSIARALVMEPKLLLLDEPFAALDEFTRAQLNADLLSLWERQRWTAIFVTHSIREAVFLADRVVIMSPRPGKIVADVPIPFDHPRSASLRNAHEFSDACAQISDHLATAIVGDQT